MTRIAAPALALAVVLTAAGCGNSDAGPDANGVAADSEGYGGLTPEEIRRQAEPMSPEEAESLGIVDTTIHMESPVGDDSLVPPPTDTLAGDTT